MKNPHNIQSVTLHDKNIHIYASLPELGESLPPFTLVGGGLGEINTQTYAGKKLLLNIFPSLDTGTCAASVRRFNKEAASLENTLILCISADLPFAQKRFCETEGIDNLVSLSCYRSDFGKEYGILMTDGPLQGLLARSILVTDVEHKIVHRELVAEITQEPDYTSALAALKI